MFNYSVRINASVEKASFFESTFGITNLETDDPIFGTALSELPCGKTEDIRDALCDSMKKIVLHTVKNDINDFDAYVRILRNANRIGIENIKICLCTFPENPGEGFINAVKRIIEAAKAFNINILFEPRKKYPVFTNEVYSALRSENTGIIFNPSEYVLGNINPFLGQLYKYKFKDDIAFIRINDMKKDGTPVLPEKGNGEIKECVSAMLSRSYNGYFSFRKYSEEFSLDDVIASFKKMMKEM
ncbi:MAG: hypothetical protein E7665_01560 [Ruminococcaceae bacterium]|nr:hypothetical protein [Oscillospiraceae bacterium]